MVFVKGMKPWNKGIPRQLETRLEISRKRKGQHNSPATEFKKGMTPWNKGKHIWEDKLHPMIDKRHSKESKRRMSETKKRLFAEGRLVSPTKGKHLSEETKMKISLAKKGKPNPKISFIRKKLFAEGKLVPWNKDKPHMQKEKHPLWKKGHSEETRKKISQKVRLWNATHKRIAWNKGKKHTKETREKIRFKMNQVWQNPEFKKKVIERSLIGLKNRPTSLEKKFIEFIEKHDLPFEFCGDGTFLIGFKNPDFIDTNGEKICIEVANEFHHDEIWAKERIVHFNKHGWKCLIIWWREIFLDKWGRNTVPNWKK